MEIIIMFYKMGSLINNTCNNPLRAGHKVTFMQIEDIIKNLDEHHNAKTYKKQRHLILKTVIGLMSTYQGDTFFLKQHSKSKVKFVALINIETCRAYAYHVLI